MLFSASSSKPGSWGVKGTVSLNLPGPRGEPGQPRQAWEGHTGAKPRPLGRVPGFRSVVGPRVFLVANTHMHKMCHKPRHVPEPVLEIRGPLAKPTLLLVSIAKAGVCDLVLLHYQLFII